jgi:hypothetical protein
MTNDDEDAGLITALDTELERIGSLVVPESEGDYGPLKKAWHFLQVYATWGVRLPSSETMLKADLGIDDPSQFAFFMPMRECYVTLHEACDHFLTRVFPEVVKIGNNVERFSKDASSDDGDIFGAVGELLDSGDAENLQAAADLLTDLSRQATQNAADAAKVNISLAEFKARLEEGSAGLQSVKAQIDQDDKVNEAVIATLQGDDKVADSLNQLTAELRRANDVHMKYAVAAGSSVVFVMMGPVGLVAAVPMASLFGGLAADKLSDIHALEKRIADGNAQLRTAVAVNRIYDSAAVSVDQSTAFTASAIEYTTTVQNAWTGISSQLDALARKIALTLKPQAGGAPKLALPGVVQIWLKQAGRAWAELRPPLTALVSNPYITVNSGNVTWVDFRAQVVKAVDDLERVA